MDAQEARIFTAVVITAVVIGVIIGFFALSVIRQQRRNLALQKANILAEIKAMEKERSRIAADLHDELGPVLSVIKFKVDLASQHAHPEKEQLDSASVQLDEMIARMREISNDLMPSTLLRKGLLVAVEEFISKIKSVSPLAIEFDHPATIAIPEHFMIHLYRVLQEVIHNTVKHAKASRMEIRMELLPGKLRLLCRDDGQGFDTTLPGTGMGLLSLRNRTELLGGTMTTESKLGKGSAFLFEIPL